MENIQFVTPLSISLPELQGFVESLGGHWNSEVGLEQGAIEEGDAAIYLSLVTDLSEDYDLEEIRAFTMRFGAKPQVAIDIHIGHGVGSPALAVHITQVLAQKWNGCMEPQDALHGVLPEVSYPEMNAK
jgi:hypothetical protein